MSDERGKTTVRCRIASEPTNYPQMRNSAIACKIVATIAGISLSSCAAGTASVREKQPPVVTSYDCKAQSGNAEAVLRVLPDGSPVSYSMDWHSTPNSTLASLWVHDWSSKNDPDSGIVDFSGKDARFSIRFSFRNFGVRWTQPDLYRLMVQGSPYAEENGPLKPEITTLPQTAGNDPSLKLREVLILAQKYPFVRFNVVDQNDARVDGLVLSSVSIRTIKSDIDNAKAFAFALSKDKLNSCSPYARDPYSRNIVVTSLRQR